LQPDIYIVTVEKQGFSSIEQRDVQVTVGRTVTLKLELQPGEVSAVVTIESSPIIDITKTDESSLISREQINELPINGRRADQFALLTPGVTRDGRFGLLSYRGQSGVFNNFTLEGNDDNQAYFAEARGRTRIASNVSANAIQEFQVTQSNFLPEFGRSAGGGINAVVRSGGNEFHGDGFWYFRNKRFNARDPLASTNPTERRDQFGGSVSGPILRDKLFYFINYEQQKRNFPLVTEDLSRVLTTDRAGYERNSTQSRTRPGTPPECSRRRLIKNILSKKEIKMVGFYTNLFVAGSIHWRTRIAALRLCDFSITGGLTQILKKFVNDNLT
jgi:hypothetical protein